MTEVREIPLEGPRVETGPTRIGDDWVGYFIRGDEVLMGILPALAQAVGALSRLSDVHSMLAMRRLQGLMGDLESVSERK